MRRGDWPLIDDSSRRAFRSKTSKRTSSNPDLPFLHALWPSLDSQPCFVGYRNMARLLYFLLFFPFIEDRNVVPWVTRLRARLAAERSTQGMLYSSFTIVDDDCAVGPNANYAQPGLLGRGDSTANLCLCKGRPLGHESEFWELIVTLPMYFIDDGRTLPVDQT